MFILDRYSVEGIVNNIAANAAAASLPYERNCSTCGVQNIAHTVPAFRGVEKEPARHPAKERALRKWHRDSLRRDQKYPLPAYLPWRNLYDLQQGRRLAR